MNAFCEHHRDSIRFAYRCFDRILLNGLIQPFQQPARVVGFFDTYRRVYPVSRDVLRGAAEQFQDWVPGLGEGARRPMECSSRRGAKGSPRRIRGALIFLKLFDRVYAPLTAGLLQPVAGDAALVQHKRAPLDRLYRRITNALDRLLHALGLTFLRPSREQNPH
jgi:hypothetical protein